MNKLLAALVTLTAASMTAVAAADRGGTDLDKALLIAMSVVIVLTVHLLPALSKRFVSWIVWGCCLVCAIYGHLTFLTHASLRAAESRAQQSALVMGTERQIEATKAALASIKARPMVMVAEALAVTEDKRERATLRLELAEGKRAEALREELVRLSATATQAQVTGATDPVTSRLAGVMGVTDSTVTVVVGMTFAILLELIGTLLWYEALRHNVVVGDENPDPENEVTVLKAAISEGKCRETVASIRSFLQCSQARALELRREIGENWRTSCPPVNIKVA
jgi:hypothetical protein